MPLRMILQAVRSPAWPFPGTFQVLQNPGSRNSFIKASHSIHLMNNMPPRTKTKHPFYPSFLHGELSIPSIKAKHPITFYIQLSPPKCMITFKIPQHTRPRPTARSKISVTDLKTESCMFSNKFWWVHTSLYENLQSWLNPRHAKQSQSVPWKM